MDEENQPPIETVDLARVRAMVDAIRTRTAIEVVDNPAALDEAGRATVPNPKRPGAVVFAASVDDVVTVVKLANEFQVPIWPVSKGRNWGYGSAAPVVENTVVLHLERMNRILEVNEQLAYAVIEPGVTYRQLKAHLDSHYPELWCDCSDGPPDGSVLGNALERGLGVTSYNDHFGTLCGLEVDSGGWLEGAHGRRRARPLPHMEHTQVGLGSLSRGPVQPIQSWRCNEGRCLVATPTRGVRLVHVRPCARGRFVAHDRHHPGVDITRRTRVGHSRGQRHRRARGRYAISARSGRKMLPSACRNVGRNAASVHDSQLGVRRRNHGHTGPGPGNPLRVAALPARTRASYFSHRRTGACAGGIQSL